MTSVTHDPSTGGKSLQHLQDCGIINDRTMRHRQHKQEPEEDRRVRLDGNLVIQVQEPKDCHKATLMFPQMFDVREQIQVPNVVKTVHPDTREREPDTEDVFTLRHKKPEAFEKRLRTRDKELVAYQLHHQLLDQERLSPTEAPRHLSVMKVSSGQAFFEDVDPKFNQQQVLDLMRTKRLTSQYFPVYAPQEPLTPPVEASLKIVIKLPKQQIVPVSPKKPKIDPTRRTRRSTAFGYPVPKFRKQDLDNSPELYHILNSKRKRH
ncbi:hypothetical protein EDD86DRAFT_212854 [Gorgonomyces haynaldii]|nr:hypothetical protein EDD86DRAFT_212854 [Gorgonomyces haynaldii]